MNQSCVKCIFPAAGVIMTNVEVALLSELEFKHQVTTARGEGGMRALRCRGVQRTGSGMEGGEGEV